MFDGDEAVQAPGVLVRQVRPAEAPGQRVWMLGLSVRARNALLRGGVTSREQVLRMGIPGLLRMTQLGAAIAAEIMAVARELEEVDDEDVAEKEQLRADAEDRLRNHLGRACDDLRTVPVKHATADILRSIGIRTTAGFACVNLFRLGTRREGPAIEATRKVQVIVASELGIAAFAGLFDLRSAQAIQGHTGRHGARRTRSRG